MTTPNPATEPARTTSTGRILIVEDDEKFCDVLRLYLEHFGYEVHTVADPHDAMQLLAFGGLDLMILDLNLAGLDGLDVLRFAKEWHPSLSVVIFTGLEMDEGLVKRCLARRADGLVRKTDGLDTLHAEVRRHLQVKSLTEQA